MTTDPLTLAQTTLEKYFEQSPGLRAAMGQLIKNVDGFTKSRATKQHDTNSETDALGIKLMPVAFPTDANYASNAVMFDYNLQVLVNSGDMRVVPMLPVVWAIFAAMVKAITDSTLLDLTLLPFVGPGGDEDLRTYRYVKNFSFANVQTGLSDPVQNKGIKGFSAICDLTLHMVFPATFVREWNDGNL
jgi:hypothetical protein